MKVKYTEIAEAIKKQVLNGDFELKRFPSGRTIAAENGVSYLTARRAIQHLLEEKVFIQKPNGRLEVNKRYCNINKKFKVALVTPSWSSAGMEKWHKAIFNAAKDNNGIVKTISYSHIDDPIINEAIDGSFDLVILNINNLTPSLVRKIKANNKKVMGLFQDWTEHGISCIDGPGPESLRLVVKHFHELGHKKIAYLATEPNRSLSEERISFWKKYIEEFNMECEYIIDRVDPFDYADVKAYNTIKNLNAEEINFTALFCASVSPMKAAMRALYELNYVIGKDISTCSLGEPKLASFFTPSITTINMPDPTDLIKEAVEFHLRFPRSAKMFRVKDHKLNIGESTGPCPE